MVVNVAVVADSAPKNRGPMTSCVGGCQDPTTNIG
jgi:hypothetical protein